MKLWARGYARAALMRARDETMNPSAAASSILRRALGSRKFQRAVKRAGKRRRSFHAGNPLPAAVIAGAALAKKLGLKFGGSPRYAEGPLVSTVAGFLELAKAGDIGAVKKLHSLATSPAEPHRAAWATVWNTELPQLEGALPVAVQREIARLDPTSVFAARTKEAAAESSAAAARRAAREEAQQERREGLLAGVASEVGKGLLGRGRGRGLPRRRKRRSRAVWE